MIARSICAPTKGPWPACRWGDTRSGPRLPSKKRAQGGAPPRSGVIVLRSLGKFSGLTVARGFRAGRIVLSASAWRTSRPLDRGRAVTWGRYACLGGSRLAGGHPRAAPQADRAPRRSIAPAWPGPGPRLCAFPVGAEPSRGRLSREAGAAPDPPVYGTGQSALWPARRGGPRGAP